MDVLSVEEIEDFVLELNNEVNNNNGKVPAAMAEKLHKYADQIRPIMTRLLEEEKQAGLKQKAEKMRLKKLKQKQNLTRKKDVPIASKIKMEEQRQTKLAIRDNLVEQLKEKEYNIQVKSNERARQVERRQYLAAEKKAGVKLAKRREDQDRLEMRQAYAQALETKKAEELQQKLQKQRELREAAESRRELMRIIKQQKDEQARQHKAELQLRLEASREKTLDDLREKRAKVLALRRKAHESKLQKKLEEKHQKEHKQQADAEARRERAHEVAWKHKVTMKEKEFWALKDVIKYDQHGMLPTEDPASMFEFGTDVDADDTDE